MATVKVSTTISCSRAINYAEKRAEVKDAYNCEITNAKQEMAMVREMYAKTVGIQAHLIIQAFSPEESAQLGAEKINQLGMELAQAIAPDHQIAVYTHVDKEHFHNHIVINSVNLETGNKYHQYKEFNHVKGLNDKILKQHHLEIVQPQKHYEKLTSEEIQIKRREGTPWKDEVRRKIDEVMQDRSVSSYEAFRERLEERGIKVHERGQNVTYELLEDNKKVRGNKLGSSYERETIQQELVSRDLAKQKIKDNPLKRPPHSVKYQQIAKRNAYKKQLRNDFKTRLSSRTNLYSPKKTFTAFKAPQPLELISPIPALAPVKQIAKTISKGISLSL